MEETDFELLALDGMAEAPETVAMLFGIGLVYGAVAVAKAPTVGICARGGCCKIGNMACC